MKFITEDELRYLYRKEPFTTYEPEPGTRLTPGARQFLADRGVNLYDEPNMGAKPIIRESLTKEICCPSANPNHNGGGVMPKVEAPVAEPPKVEEPAAPVAPPVKDNRLHKRLNWRTKMVRAKMCSVEALFLMTEHTLLGEDIMMAQELARLCKQFTDIRHMVEGRGTAMNLPCGSHQGVDCDCFSEDMEDCFEITDFHVQLEKGKIILALHQLRCALREIEPVMLQAFEGNDAAIGPCLDAIGKINQIIYAISQMIYGAVGGKECQRRM